MKNKEMLSNYFFELNQFLSKKIPDENLYKPINYMFDLGGKSIRPFFLLHSYKIFGGKGKQINKVALALESLHNFSLMHDDVMDNAEKRRGKLSVPKKWNQNTAILSGDALLIICFQILNSINFKNKKEITKDFIESALRICEGQQLDLEMESRTIIDKKEYFKMIELKTAALFVFCFKVGCFLAGGNKINQRKMKKIGLQIGLLFQIQDDYLDFFGTKKVGKKIGQDVLESKKTFLFCELLNFASKKDKKEFVSTYNNKKINAIKKIKYVKFLFERYDVKNKTLQKIIEINTTINGLINDLSISKSNKENFIKYIHKLSKRTN